jgi:poly(A) polymerase/tRNA nucleotidyltransferase (CCA-adding enzyme)
MAEGFPAPAAIDACLAAALAPGELYAVGGRVRDEIRSALDGVPREAKDLDYVVTGLSLEELTTALRRVGRADVVGASFAVVKATLEGTTVDVALPRREFSTGLGHREFVVEAGAGVTLEDDLVRRDFRMNMVARALPSGRIVDPYGGEDDIRVARIDILRSQAFEEDPLRMLRACQFAARFEFSVSPQTLAAMRAAAPLVASVSAERVRDELSKLLELARRPSLGLELMRESDVLAYVLPEIAEGIGVEQNEWHAYDVYRHTLATVDAAPPGDLVLRLAALFHDVGKPRTKDGPHFYQHEVLGERLTREALERLRFPASVIDDVASLVRQHMYSADPDAADKTVRRFIRRIGASNLERQFALRAADIVGSGLPKRGPENERFQERVYTIAAQRPALGVTDLAVSGQDVIEELIAAGRLPQGSRGGPIVGEIMRALLEQVTDEPARNEPGELRSAIRSLIALRSGRDPGA